MAKAKLTDGTIIKLEHDCECITHRNPHWVHMDNLRRQANQSLFDRLKRAIESANHQDAVLASQAFAQEELRRLREKRWHMEKLGIVELIQEPDDETPVHHPKRRTRKRKAEPEKTFTGDRIILTDPITHKQIGS